jgi:ubiquinol-cytochrome c reductase cytochrome b subunit
MFIGSQHVESPYVEIGQVATALYFGWFLVIVPVVGLIENTLMDIALEQQSNTNNITSNIERLVFNN